MKTLFFIIFTVYAIISGILYFIMKIKQSKVTKVNFAYILALIVLFIVSITWGWIIYPIYFIKTKIN